MAAQEAAAGGSRFRLGGRLEWYGTVLPSGLVPLFYHGDPEVAGAVARALVDGGAAAVEFTNRGPGALRVFQELAEQPILWDAASLGVGSVIDAPTAALFIAAGARFVVSPSFNTEVARLCIAARSPTCRGAPRPPRSPPPRSGERDRQGVPRQDGRPGVHQGPARSPAVGASHAHRRRAPERRRAWASGSPRAPAAWEWGATWCARTWSRRATTRRSPATCEPPWI